MYRMSRRSVCEALLLLAVLGALLAVSTAAVSSAHRHVVGRDCDLCCAGHVPALQSPRASDVHLPVVVDRQISAEEHPDTLDPDFSATLGRAPPL
jgi:hypothetical protein